MPSPTDLLPSVSQLLEKPPVKVLLRRLKRSTVANGVATYLTQLSEELPQRFSTGSIPSPSEIADRAARFVLGLQTAGRSQSVVNATGKMLGRDWISPPLSESAQTATLEVMQGFVAAEPDGADVATALLAEELCVQTTAEAAVVLHSYEVALIATLTSLASAGEVLIPRSNVGRLGSTNLAELVTHSGCTLREVGAVDDCQLQQFRDSVSAHSALILSSRSDSYQLAGDAEECTRDELIKFCHEHRLPYVDAMAGAPLRKLDGNLSALPTVEQSIQAGADLVIVRGEGLVGGPPCGIVGGPGKVRHQDFRKRPCCRQRARSAPPIGTSVDNLRVQRNIAGDSRRDSASPLGRHFAGELAASRRAYGKSACRV